MVLIVYVKKGISTQMRLQLYFVLNAHNNALLAPNSVTVQVVQLFMLKLQQECVSVLKILQSKNGCVFAIKVFTTLLKMGLNANLATPFVQHVLTLLTV